MCSSTDIEWIKASGDGIIYSFSVVWRPPSSAFDAPYVLALVDLEEGPRLMTHVVEGDPADVFVGARVTVRFQQLTEEITVPVFVIAEQSGAKLA